MNNKCKERFIWQGKKYDTNITVKGYLTSVRPDDGVATLLTYEDIANGDIDTMVHFDTIEPVAVKAVKSEKWDYICPNCNRCVIVYDSNGMKHATYYCDSCGQRLDWSNEERNEKYCENCKYVDITEHGNSYMCFCSSEKNAFKFMKLHKKSVCENWEERHD